MLLITMQAKGGVGKTFATSCLAQYCQSIQQPTVLYDADPNNASLGAITALGAERLPMLDNSPTGALAIDEMAFDQLMERMTQEPPDTAIIVDAGATTFLPLLSYLVSHAVWEVCAEYQHPLVLHPVIAGGPDCEESVHGFAQLAAQVPTHYLITTNPYHGRVVVGGVTLEDHPDYRECASRVLARVDLPAYPSPIFARDVQTLLSRHQTFAEAIQSPDTALMTRQRLRQVYAAIMDAYAPAWSVLVGDRQAPAPPEAATGEGAEASSKRRRSR